MAGEEVLQDPHVLLAAVLGMQHDPPVGSSYHCALNGQRVSVTERQANRCVVRRCRSGRRGPSLDGDALGPFGVSHLDLSCHDVVLSAHHTVVPAMVARLPSHSGCSPASVEPVTGDRQVIAHVAGARGPGRPR